MRINKFLINTPINFSQHVKKEDKKETTNPIHKHNPSSVSPELYAAYNNISFRGRTYDGTNFRVDLEKRAEQSQTKLRLYPEIRLSKDIDIYKCDWQPDKNEPEQELQLFKTKHNEYVKSPDGAKIYKIRYVSDRERIVQQVIASKLYNSVGVRTPEYIAFEKDGKTGYLVEVFEEKLESAETNKKALYESFVADVWLANRNGLSKDNTRIDKDGNPVKMSVSGALGYRACGKPKEKKVYYSIEEINTMRDYSINPDSAKALSSMTDEELYDAIEAVTSRTDYNKILEITGRYWPRETFEHDISNVIENRKSSLKNFPKNDKINKLLKKRGLLDKDTPSLPNLRSFDPSFNIDVESALKITDEQWQKLKDRGLFDKHYWLKPFGLLDYKFLAKMTDEEHQKALKRGLYAPSENDKTMHDGIGGAEISELCKLTDSQWKSVINRNLLEAKLNHNIDCFWLYEFINSVVGIDDFDWHKVERSDILDTRCKPVHVHQFLELTKSEETKDFNPLFETRVKWLSNIEKGKSYLDRGFHADDILKLASLDNKSWEKVMEITQNLNDVKMGPSSLLEIVGFDDDVYNSLKKRNLLTTSDRAYGLKDLAVLSEEDWANIEKRKIQELNPKEYGAKDWAYLATLTDEQFKLAQDKKLFDNRSKFENDTSRYYDGQEVSLLVSSLDEKGWENYEKRGLYQDFVVFNGWSWTPPSGWLAVKLAQLSDIEFKKFEEVQHNTSYIYPSTALDLVKLNDVEYKRLMDRNLFKYMNTHESWDNYSEDAPVMIALAQLDDKEYETFQKMKNDCKTVAAKTLIIKADKLGLDKKQSIAELSIREKKDYLRLLISKPETFLSEDFQKNYPLSPILPQNVNEYSAILNKLVKSSGIDVRPLGESEKTEFFNAVEKISAPNSEFKTLKLKNLDFKLITKYDRKEFVKDISNLVKNLDKSEQMKIWDYFGFELSKNHAGKIIMSGYPALINNGEKLKEIENSQTKQIIEQIKPFVKKFTIDNAVLPDGKYISVEMAATLNEILKGLPELFSIIGKEQHDTHDYTVDVHTLAVLQECINNPYFDTLNKKEKQMLVLTSLFHDITKEEKSIDKSHPGNSAYDAYFILQKFGMNNKEKQQIYQLIKTHDFFAHCNKANSEDEQNKLVKKYAYELRADNLAELALMFTKADLKSVKRNGYFYEIYKDSLNTVSNKLSTEIKEVKKTAIPLPQTVIPKAGKIVADGVNVKEITTTDQDGKTIKNKIIYLKKGLDLSQYGFAKGVTADNFNVIVHGFDSEYQQVTLDALDLPDKEALLSTSYVFYEKGNYHTFRQQGFIKNIPADNIGAAYYRDFGSGCKKTEQSLIDDYINGGNIIYRKYFSDLMKKELNLSNAQYIELYSQIKDKPIEQIEKEKPHVAYAIKNIFSKMEIHKRKFQRDYNEVLVGKGETTGIFFVGKDKDGTPYKAENIPEFLRKYAQDNDLPIIYFGE